MKIQISQLIRDPTLKAIFEKAERDQGQTPAEIDRKPIAPRQAMAPPPRLRRAYSSLPDKRHAAWRL